MISAVLVVFNEAEKLDRCLKSINDFVSEIVVVDLGSIDASKVICKKYGAKIFKHKFAPFVEEVRNYAISKASKEWVLVLDPDEVMPDTLKDQLKQIAEENNFSAVNIPRKNIFFNKWIAHTNWWPDRHIRFFQKGQVKWKEKIHKYPEVSGKVLNLEAKVDFAIIHYGYDSIAQFIDRQNRYSTIEAKNNYDNKEKFSWTKFIWKPLREFLVRYIRYKGFLDGFPGFALVSLMMIYQMMVMVKVWELERER